MLSASRIARVRSGPNRASQRSTRKARMGVVPREGRGAAPVLRRLRRRQQQDPAQHAVDEPRRALAAAPAREVDRLADGGVGGNAIEVAQPGRARPRGSRAGSARASAGARGDVPAISSSRAAFQRRTPRTSSRSRSWSGGDRPRAELADEGRRALAALEHPAQRLDRAAARRRRGAAASRRRLETAGEPHRPRELGAGDRIASRALQALEDERRAFARGGDERAALEAQVAGFAVRAG